jgi:hypothetical protein
MKAGLMTEPGLTSEECRDEVERLRARIERLRVVAEAADLASIEIDRDIRGLEPRVNTMQEAAAALSTLVYLTGSVQKRLVAALNQLEPGDRDGTADGS